MKTNIINRLRQLTVLLAAAGLTGCGWVKDDLEPCPAKLSLKFVYDYNMKFADAFHHEVRSVNVWAFDSATGALVWKGAATDAQLPSEPGFVMETPLEGGSYDFVAWCGLTETSPMQLATYNPASKQELEVTLATEQNGTMLVSDAEIPGLFHGMKSYTYTPDKLKPSIEQVTIPLIKDTNAIRVLLQNLDGTEMKQEDFTVTITDANSELGWNNAVLQGPTVTYMPWGIRYGVIGQDNGQSTQEAGRAGDMPESITTVATLMNEFSLSRLIAGQKSTLTVRRNSDGTDIIRIPLIDYLLLIKGHYGNMTDQEYLDRQDDYSILFFIDASNNWYMAGGIYINSWAVVPPQNENM